MLLVPFSQLTCDGTSTSGRREAQLVKSSGKAGADAISVRR